MRRDPEDSIQVERAAPRAVAQRARVALALDVDDIESESDKETS
jgi:hypothetical protein